MADSSDLRQMVMAFRVSELQVLLGFAGKNKCGRKQELLVRALQLIQRGPPTPVQIKIRELYRQIQSEKGASSMRPIPRAESSSHYGRNDDERRRYPNVYQSSMSSLSSSSSDRHDRQLAPKTSSGASSKSGDDTTTPSDKEAESRVGVIDACVPGEGAGPTPPPAHSGEKGSSYDYKPHTGSYSSHSSVPHSQFPVLSDVRFKRLPFYDLLGELLKPSTLVPRNTQKYQETTCVFHLTPQQAQDIAMSRDMRPGSKCDYHVQVQLRFCLMETTCEQADNFPPSICVRVNGKIAQLPNPIPTNKPGVEPKRPGRPVNITSLCRISPTQPNQLVISWSAEYGRNFCVAVYLVRKQTSDVLLTRLKGKGEKPAEFSRALIKEKLRTDADSEIATTSLRVSLLCPLGKMRMQVPCRASTCTHLQCFDAATFLMMNEKKPTWICPVCDKEAVFDKLMLDGMFIEIYKQTTVNDIEFFADGSWKPLSDKKETHIIGNTPTTVKSESKIQKEEKSSKSSSSAKPAPQFIDLTLSSDEEDDPPPAKRPSRDDGPPAKRQNRGSVSSPEAPAVIEVDTPPRRSPADPLQINDSPVCLSSTGNSDTSPRAPPANVLDVFDDSDDSSNTIISNRSAGSSPDRKSPIHSPSPPRTPVKSPMTSSPAVVTSSPHPLSMMSASSVGGGLTQDDMSNPLIRSVSSEPLRTVDSSSRPPVERTSSSPARAAEPLRFITAPAFRNNPYPFPFPSDFTAPVPPRLPDPPMAHTRPSLPPPPAQALPLSESDFNFNVDDLYPFGLSGLSDMPHQGDF